MMVSVSKAWRPQRALLLRGEGQVALIGLIGAVVLVVLLAASGGWGLYVQRQTFQGSRQRQADTIAVAVAPVVESLLAHNDVAGVRRLVDDLRRRCGLTVCRVTLADGTVIADGAVAKPAALELPERWPENPSDRAAGADLSMTQVPLRVTGRGTAWLQLATAIAAPPPPGDVIWGIGLIAIAGLVVIWLLYRRLRTRLAVLAEIGDSLVALERGETVTDALTLRTAAKPAVEAWNKLITEFQALRQQATRHKITDGLTGTHSSLDLEKACDCLSQGLLLVDDAGRIAYANGAAAAFAGVEREKVVGQPVAAFAQDPKLKEAIDAAVSGACRVRKTLETSQAGADRAGVLRYTLRLVRQNGGAHAVLITIDDITQQRVAEAARHAFVAQAAHELRTPLTNIRLYVDNVLDEGEHDPAFRAKALNVINKEARRLEMLVGQMLSMAEIEAGCLDLHKDDVRVDKLLAELEADFQAQASEKSIALSLALPPKLPVIQADRGRMLLALHNVLGNALKYTPSGGKVTVAVAIEAANCVVRITDTGIGIDEAELGQIFDRLYRSKDPRVAQIPGTGLGLTLAREIARQHGGEITVESRLNTGSTFTITFPATAKEG